MTASLMTTVSLAADSACRCCYRNCKQFGPYGPNQTGRR
jgi:hypothetical protein